MMNVARPPGAVKAESATPMGIGQPHDFAWDPKARLPTFIYDYFLKTRQPDLAKAMLNTPSLQVQTKDRTKASPSGRDVNGINDSMGPKDEIAKKIEEMPVPDLPDVIPDQSFLMDWFCTFWDVYHASKNNNSTAAAAQYVNVAKQRMSQGMVMNGRLAATGQMVNNGMQNMQQRAMVNSMRRGGMPQGQMTQPGAEGVRPQSPMSAENQPSPKRRALDGGGFPTPQMPGGPNPGGPGQAPNMPQNMDPNQFNMMNNMGMMDNNDQRMNSAQGGALADYQMQLMLLEQQNKRRLLMARQEQEVVSQTGPPGATGQPAMINQQGMPFNMGMSPRRAGQSPGPNETMKRNASSMGQSPRPEGIPVTRSSPAPGVFDPNQAAMQNQQFFQNGPNGMRPGMPGGPQPGFQQGPNGQMRPMGLQQAPRPGMPGGQFPPNMAGFNQNPQPGQQPPGMNGPGGQQQGNQPPTSMPPPSAPPNQTGRTQPSSPAPGQAPPTPRQNKDAASKKKDSAKKDTGKNKQQPKKVGATPSSEAEPQAPTPTPSTPVDPHPPPNVLKPNGAPQPGGGQNGVQAQPGSQPDALGGMDQSQMANMPGMGDTNGDNNMSDFNFEFGGPDTNVLDGFDFDSFLQVDGSNDNFDFGADGFNMGGGMELADNH